MVAWEQAAPPKWDIGRRQKSCSERGRERKGKGERKGLANFSFRPYPTWEPVHRLKNSKIKIVSSFSAIKLCFVISVFNNKMIILLNLVEYPLILAHLV